MAKTNAPDVRVRLSAEGVAEVVSAFKRVQAEAEKAQKQTKMAGQVTGFLRGQIAGLASILPTLSVAAAVGGFVALTKRSMELADGLGKLNQKTGISVETLSTLSFAARTADVEQEALAKGLIKFTRAVDDYDKGASKAKEAVRGLFGDSAALKGLDTDQRLLKVVDALGKLEPGAKRTGAAMAFFGKAGADLLPLIDDLGNGGFDELRKKAERLGLVVDKDLAAATQRANDAMKDLESEAQGMAMQFASGLAPQLANAAQTIVDETSQAGVNGFQKIGEYAGKAINSIVAAFLIVGKTIAFVTTEGKLLWEDFGNYAKDTVKGIWPLLKGAVAYAAGVSPLSVLNEKDLEKFKPGGNQFLTRLETFINDARKSVSDLFKETPASTKRKRDRSSSDDQAEADRARKAAEALADAQADARAKIAAADLKAQEAAERERYEKGMESLRGYYAARIAMAQQAGQAEAAALYDKLLRLQSAPLAEGELPAERQAQIVKAAADWQVKLKENAAQVKALQADEAKEADALQQKALDFEKKIQAAQGDRFAAAKAAIDAEAAQLDEILRKQGVAAGERSQRVEAFRTSGYQQVDFQQLEAQARAAMDDLEARRQEITRSVQAGTLFTFQGEQQMMAAERERLPILREIADQMLRAAITPEQIQAARDYAASVDQLAISSDKAAQEMAAFKENVSQALTGELSNWLSSGIDQAESLGDAFRGLALSVVQSLRQIAAQMLATYMIQKLLGFVGMSVPGGSSGPAPVKKAAGGLVLGPGTGTSDSIPARLSNYEHVTRAAIVRQPGVLPFLARLNAGDASVLDLVRNMNLGTPALRRRGGTRFAEGGLVDAQAAGAGRGGLDATLTLDEGLLLKRLEASPEFHRVMVRTAQANRKAMTQALRG